jgi:hypothetical protein
VINVIRAHLAEFGIVAPVGRKGVEALLDVVANPTTTMMARIGQCRSISSASDLQIGHVAIAIPQSRAANNYTPTATFDHQYMPAKALTGVSDTALKTRKDAEPEQWEPRAEKSD